ncbi:UDP-glucose 4-epimerase GalE [Paenarthrobacter sp. Z7-10]|uniref:UDP-glucose 4-epimerase GalE n=1 Tax=Paenarthrobacter sp. Z7-10 TaxID=2787635 RepID=UPI0022A8D5E1|nr:UDP-glucose 4-epimerase GalE [Paenarthrobacter sp. Z7-10]MCZ2403924.1 UDP-glucose 4-epimerase GalE [Paenarthrobacter sp. Z7-10]
MTVLVTGGAGYIGAHVVRLLLERGESVVVVDNLSTGRAERVAGAQMVGLDLAAPQAQDRLEGLIQENSVDSVIHLAALKQVGESVADPLLYYRTNVGSTTALLAAMERTGVRRLVFSSSAAAYGVPEVTIVDESTPCRPINPYGETKLIGEWMTAACAKAWGLRAVNLRYFNVAGAASADLADPAALNLVPIAIGQILAGRSPVVFGSDYDTPDGTCIRDYVHISDLADAHLAALDSTAGSGPLESVLNVGTGAGASVLEVLEMLRRVSGRTVDAEIADRRPGDPPQLIADVARIQHALGWQAKRNLEDIVTSAWEAELANRSK